MSKEKTIIQKMKAFFSAEEVTEIKFEDVKSGDKLYRVSALEVDGTIQEVPTDGTEDLIDVEDGDITLDDGTVLTVASGVITAVVLPDTTEEASVEETDVKLSKVFSAFEKINFTLIDQISKWQIEVINTTFEIDEIVTYKWEEEDETVYTLSSGEYELEDGTKIFVDNDGRIIMKMLTDGTIETTSNSAATEAPAEDAAPVEEMSASFSAEFFDGFEKMIDEFSSMRNEIASLKAEVATYAKTPSTEPTKTKVDFKAVNGETNSKPKSVLHSMLK